jgi:prophage DNA circulation protein
MSKPAWMKALKTASFRGVTFKIRDHNSTHGRRIIDHEFPNSDKPYTENLGRKQRKFSITGYLIGDDYMAQRDKVIDACEADGPGYLVHPYLGQKTVECPELTVSERATDGGFVELNFTFHETTKKVTTPQTIELDAVASAAAAAVESVRSDFVEALELALKIQGAGAAFAAKIDAVTAGIEKAVAQAKHLAADPLGIVALTNSIRNFKAAVADLLASPDIIAKHFADTIRAFIDAIMTPEKFLPSYARAAGGPARIRAARPGKIVAPILSKNTEKLAANTATATGKAAAKIFAITDALTDTITTGAWVTAAAQAYYLSETDALAERAEILAQIETLAQAAGSDDSFSALQALAISTEKSVPGATASPTINEVTLTDAVPSVVLSFDLYGALELEPELVFRNGIRHPGFLPVGEVLEVLSE